MSVIGYRRFWSAGSGFVPVGGREGDVLPTGRVGKVTVRLRFGNVFRPRTLCIMCGDVSGTVPVGDRNRSSWTGRRAEGPPPGTGTVSDGRVGPVVSRPTAWAFRGVGCQEVKVRHTIIGGGFCVC
jgi:hypothetical protein